MSSTLPPHHVVQARSPKAVRHAARSRRVVCVVGAGALVALLGACGQSTLQPADTPAAPPAAAGSTSAPSEATSTTSAAAFDVPVAGTCDVAHKYGDVLTAPATDCVEPHLSEIFAVGELTAADRPDTVAEADLACRNAAPAFLGSDHWGASRVRLEARRPSADEWAAGARWYACTLSVFNVVDSGAAAESRTGTLSGALAAGLGDLRGCYQAVNSTYATDRTTPCSQPHRFEAVDPVIALPVGAWPGVDAMYAAADGCDQVVATYVGADREDILVGATGPTEATWVEGGPNAMVCYAGSDADLVGSVVGIGAGNLPTG